MRISDQPCGRCGLAAVGYATINETPYCHDGEDPTCYQLACWEMSASNYEWPPRRRDDAWADDDSDDDGVT